MKKKLGTIIVALFSLLPVFGQSGSGLSGAAFRPEAGQYQFSISLGSGKFFDDNATYLLPQYSNTSGSIGLGSDAIQSDDVTTYLNIGSMNNNSLTNIASFQIKYFYSQKSTVNVSFSMNINLTPSKDYIEGDNTVPDMIIPAQKYISAKMTNNWSVAIGSDHYFTTRNERINPYVGVLAGFQMVRIETNEPYTGESYTDSDGVTEVPKQLLVAGSNAGQQFAARGAVVAGVEYSLAPGLILGFEFNPVSYRYDVVQLCPKGFETWNASSHNVKIFEMPSLKLGMRF